MIYLLYDPEWDNWKEISIDYFEQCFREGKKVMAVVVYVSSKK